MYTIFNIEEFKVLAIYKMIIKKEEKKEEHALQFKVLTITLYLSNSLNVV